MEFYYSIDNYGVIRKHDNGVETVVSSDTTSAEYLEMREWWDTTGYLISVDRPQIQDLTKTKFDAIVDIVNVGNEFVNSFTYNTLDCEIQSFDTLAAVAEQVMVNGILYASKQIIIQAQMTGKTPQQVVERILELKQASDMVVPVMSSFRQNATVMINACTTVEQVMQVKHQIITFGLDAIKEMLGNVGNV